MRTPHRRVAAVLLLLLCGSSPAAANTIVVGSFGFVVTLPPGDDPANIGLNDFTVQNTLDLTAGALFQLLALELTVTAEGAAEPSTILLGDSSIFSPLSYPVLGDTRFTEARLKGQLEHQSFELLGQPRMLFTANSIDFSVALEVVGGYVAFQTLDILVEGQTVPITSVPEPASFLYVVASGIALAVGGRRWLTARPR